jgi:hypothetical protein
MNYKAALLFSLFSFVFWVFELLLQQDVHVQWEQELLHGLPSASQSFCDCERCFCRFLTHKSKQNAAALFASCSPIQCKLSGEQHDKWHAEFRCDYWRRQLESRAQLLPLSISDFIRLVSVLWPERLLPCSVYYEFNSVLNKQDSLQVLEMVLSMNANQISFFFCFVCACN